MLNRFNLRLLVGEGFPEAFLLESRHVLNLYFGTVVAANLGR
jgi:hypothetical protein